MRGKEKTCTVPISVYNQGEKLKKEKGVEAAFEYYNEFFKKCFVKPVHKKAPKMVRGFVDENRKNPTPAEDRFKKFLNKNKIGYNFQVPVCCDGKWYIVDFLINSKTAKKKIVVEIDGGYHNDPEQRKEDELREERLRKKGYEIVRIKNEETEKGAIYDVLFRKMRCVGASDVLNKLTVKKYLS